MESPRIQMEFHQITKVRTITAPLPTLQTKMNVRIQSPRKDPGEKIWKLTRKISLRRKRFEIQKQKRNRAKLTHGRRLLLRLRIQLRSPHLPQLQLQLQNTQRKPQRRNQSLEISL